MRTLSLLRGVFVTVLFCASVQLGVLSNPCAFEIFGSSIDWNDADDKCKSSGKQLAMVSASNKENILGQSQFQNCGNRSTTQKYWIGNRYPNINNVNCTIIFKKDLCQNIDEKSCVHVHINNDGGSFVNGACTENNNGFICEARANHYLGASNISKTTRSVASKKALVSTTRTTIIPTPSKKIRPTASSSAALPQKRTCLNETVSNLTQRPDPIKLEKHKLRCSIKVTENKIAEIRPNVDSLWKIQAVFGTKGAVVKSREFSILFPDVFKNKGRLLVAALSNKSVHKLPEISKQMIDGKSVTTKLRTPVLTVKVFPELKDLKDNVTTVLRHLKGSKESDIHHCVFLHLSADTKSNTMWSNEGCTVKNKTKTHTTCSCNHLTTFAVLLQVSQDTVPEDHKLALDIIFYIGCALSLFGETVAILVYLALLKKPYTDHTRIQIRMNLLGSLAAAQITFLSGIEATDNQAACIFVSTLLHYLFLAAMDWMLMEGVMMYFKIVSVFNVGEKLVWFYVFAWGFPTLMVALSIIIASSSADGMQGYLNSKFCWMSYSNNLVWTFAGPVVIIAVVNIIILILVVRELNKLENLGNENVNKIWQGVKACMTLTPLLGLTWVFGLLAVKDAELVFIYIFAVFNSFQGFLIFVFHVLMSKEVRTAYQLKKQQWLANKNEVQPQKPAWQ